MLKSFIFLVKSILGNFLRHLATFSGHTVSEYSLIWDILFNTFSQYVGQETCTQTHPPTRPTSTSLIDFFSSNPPPQTERLFDTINQKHEPHRPTNICFPLKDLHFSPHDKSNRFEATASREPATTRQITSPMRPRERSFYDESNWLFSEYETA